MDHRRASITQVELTRYAKAMAAAGIAEWRVIVRPDRSHEIIAGKADRDVASGPDPDELLK